MLSLRSLNHALILVAVAAIFAMAASPAGSQVFPRRATRAKLPATNGHKIRTFDTTWSQSYHTRCSRLHSEMENRELEATLNDPPGPPTWTISNDDPATILNGCRHLSIRPGWTLKAYFYRDGGNGNGFVVGARKGKKLPSAQKILPLADRPWEEICDELDNIYQCMTAVVGDRSPESYLEASMAHRELLEFGALWHGVSWRTHTVLDRLPLPEETPANGQDADRPLSSVGTKPEEWKWKTPKPEQWKPTVEFDGDCVTVTFYTHSALMTREEGETIVRHQDTYLEGFYVPVKSSERVIAVGVGGFCF